MSAGPHRAADPRPGFKQVDLNPEALVHIGLKLLEHLDIELEDVKEPLRDDRHAAALAMEVGEVALQVCSDTDTIPTTIEQLREGIDNRRLERDSFAAWVGINLADQPGGHADVFVIRDWLSRESDCRKWWPRWSWSSGRRGDRANR